MSKCVWWRAFEVVIAGISCTIFFQKRRELKLFLARPELGNEKAHTVVRTESGSKLEYDVLANRCYSGKK